MGTPTASTTRTAASVTSGPIPSPGIRVTRCLDMGGPSSYIPAPFEPPPENESVAIELLCRKIGMTRIFTETGDSIAVTVLEAGPNPVVQKKSVENDGYTALQLGFGEKRRKTVGKPRLGHFEKAGRGAEGAPRRVPRHPRGGGEVRGRPGREGRRLRSRPARST